jgi:hypothetical protein
VTPSRDEAEKALAEIAEARGRIDRAHGYRDAAPFFILWGLIWLVANLTTEIAPGYGQTAWVVGILVGSPVSLYLAWTQARRRGERIRQAGGDAKAIGGRIALTWATPIAFFIGAMIIVGPLDPRQTDAFISLFWAALYMGVGAWVGLRLFTIGAVTAAAIVFGYLVLQEHYFLWMGLVAGGGLIAGGLWLRKL